MYSRWVGNNVDLDLLFSYLKRYFEEKKFKVEASRGNVRRVIVCKIPYISKSLQIVIEGDHNDFSVETSYEAGRFPLIFYGLYSLFGGGFSLLNEVKTRELMSALEKDLKFFLDRAVSLLTNSKK